MDGHTLSRARDATTAATLPKIAYLTGQYPEVSLTFILREVEALRALGADVITCSIRQTPPEQHPGPAEKEAARTTFHVLKAARNPLKLIAAQAYALTRPRRYFGALALAWKTRSPGLKAALYQLVFFLEATVLARHLEAQKVGHIHNHFVFGSATVAMLSSELTGIPYSFTLHGPADLFEPYRWALAEKTARAAFVATISHYARSQLMFFSDPAHWHKIRIIHCGVAPDLYGQPPQPARSDDDIRLVFVGRLAPVKGIRVLFEAMQRLAPEMPRLRLILVGDGPDREGLEEAAKPLGDRVEFTGYMSQTEVAETLQSADICVLPSFAEGVPVVLMEALASGRPVIATQVAGVGELVRDGETGFMVPPGDVESLMARIRQLAEDPALRAAMGAAGRDTVRADFNIRTEAARMATLMAGAAGSDLRPAPYREVSDV
ncbi:glycosyltransferase [Roseobacter sinensis]|uniref:Glycosyltransferase n=1 Tax=Roseobacter sinensis TaxID=2931391 RepID=A0ABT3BKL5_9RHOB|nr:glycosyltransferase [Roseobacter sp. WL0113]MCV3273773.1 glycosyltransferase [Roseobacter sp. WL0113]